MVLVVELLREVASLWKIYLERKGNQSDAAHEPKGDSDTEDITASRVGSVARAWDLSAEGPWDVGILSPASPTHLFRCQWKNIGHGPEEGVDVEYSVEGSIVRWRVYPRSRTTVAAPWQLINDPTSPEGDPSRVALHHPVLREGQTVRLIGFSRLDSHVSDTAGNLSIFLGDGTRTNKRIIEERFPGEPGAPSGTWRSMAGCIFGVLAVLMGFVALIMLGTGALVSFIGALLLLLLAVVLMVMEKRIYAPKRNAYRRAVSARWAEELGLDVTSGAPPRQDRA